MADCNRRRANLVCVGLDQKGRSDVVDQECVAGMGEGHGCMANTELSFFTLEESTLLACFPR